MSSFESLQQRIDQGEIILLDGATGTELDRRGVPMSSGAWSGAALATHPQIVRQVHEDYVRAGVDIIIANTFSASRPVLERAGLGERTQELNNRAVTLAKQALDAAADREVCVAGSIFNIPRAIRSDRDLSAEQCEATYKEQAHILADAGVDLIMLEMMSDTAQTAYAIEAAVSTGLPTWVGFSCGTVEDDSPVMLLNNPTETFAEALDGLMALGGSLISVMHTQVEDTAPALEVLRNQWSGPVGAYSHSGEFMRPTWKFDDIISPNDYLTEAQNWLDIGA
ncbi:MAG: homocysteine S-methyltransferase family protein, partial [SAR202 cluster bacterium]|nr:homocysteine S-methyltransferase family protein [SAR202 cluster bacterium]